ncbi:DUF5958 family protein [Streptomyces sp. NPDC005141]
MTLTKWRVGMDTLPAYELTKSFRLPVALFSIADTRRRTLYCAGECGACTTCRIRHGPQPEVTSCPGSCRGSW